MSSLESSLRQVSPFAVIAGVTEANLTTGYHVGISESDAGALLRDSGFLERLLYICETEAAKPPSVARAAASEYTALNRDFTMCFTLADECAALESLLISSPPQSIGDSDTADVVNYVSDAICESLAAHHRARSRAGLPTDDFPSVTALLDPISSGFAPLLPLSLPLRVAGTPAATARLIRILTIGAVSVSTPATWTVPAQRCAVFAPSVAAVALYSRACWLRAALAATSPTLAVAQPKASHWCVDSDGASKCSSEITGFALDLVFADEAAGVNVADPDLPWAAAINMRLSLLLAPLPFPSKSPFPPLAPHLCPLPLDWLRPLVQAAAVVPDAAAAIFSATHAAAAAATAATGAASAAALAAVCAFDKAISNVLSAPPRDSAAARALLSLLRHWHLCTLTKAAAHLAAASASGANSGVDGLAAPAVAALLPLLSALLRAEVTPLELPSADPARVCAALQPTFPSPAAAARTTMQLAADALCTSTLVASSCAETSPTPASAAPAVHASLPAALAPFFSRPPAPASPAMPFPSSLTALTPAGSVTPAPASGVMPPLSSARRLRWCQVPEHRSVAFSTDGLDHELNPLTSPDALLTARSHQRGVLRVSVVGAPTRAAAAAAVAETADSTRALVFGSLVWAPPGAFQQAPWKALDRPEPSDIDVIAEDPLLAVSSVSGGAASAAASAGTASAAVSAPVLLALAGRLRRMQLAARASTVACARVWLGSAHTSNALPAATVSAARVLASHVAVVACSHVSLDVVFVPPGFLAAYRHSTVLPVAGNATDSATESADATECARRAMYLPERIAARYGVPPYELLRAAENTAAASARVPKEDHLRCGSLLLSLHASRLAECVAEKDGGGWTDQDDAVAALGRWRSAARGLLRKCGIAGSAAAPALLCGDDSAGTVARETAALLARSGSDPPGVAASHWLDPSSTSCGLLSRVCGCVDAALAGGGRAAAAEAAVAVAAITAALDTSLFP